MATEIQFNLKNDSFTAKIKTGKWANYHVTKHLLINYYEEGYDRLYGIGSKIVRGIRDNQKEFDCKVNNTINQENSCGKCDYYVECDKLIGMVKEKYFLSIKDNLVNDYKNPRHASYIKHGIGWGQNHTVILDDVGKSVVTVHVDEKENYINVLTSYRTEIKEEINFRFDRLKFINRLYLRKAIRHWQYRFDSEDYKDVNKYLKTNWT